MRLQDRHTYCCRLINLSHIPSSINSHCAVYFHLCYAICSLKLLCFTLRVRQSSIEWCKFSSNLSRIRRRLRRWLVPCHRCLAWRRLYRASVVRRRECMQSLCPPVPLILPDTHKRARSLNKTVSHKYGTWPLTTDYIHCVPKLAAPLFHTPNLVCSSWILMKYRTLLMVTPIMTYAPHRVCSV